MEGKVLIVNKKSGQTPLECLNQIKIANPALAHLPLTYAGRLDPLASGVLIVLIGDECHKKDEYLNLPKEYLVTLLFGFATDTYDLMGKVFSTEELFNFSRSGTASDFRIALPEKLNNSEVQDDEDLFDTLKKRVSDILPKFTGRIRQAYPPYSSRTVSSKPLFKWAREGKLDEITIPSHDVYVETIEIVSQSEIKGAALIQKIKDDISRVAGDFRQTEIVALWRETLKDKMEIKYKTMTLKISCHSGVYVRAIANGIGMELKVPTLALDIVRTKVGDYKIEEI